MCNRKKMNAVVSAAAFSSAAAAAAPTADQSHPMNWNSFNRAVAVVALAGFCAAYCYHTPAGVITTMLVAVAHLASCAAHCAPTQDHASAYAPSIAPFLTAAVAIALAATASIVE